VALAFGIVCRLRIGNRFLVPAGNLGQHSKQPDQATSWGGSWSQGGGLCRRAVISGVIATRGYNEPQLIDARAARRSAQRLCMSSRALGWLKGQGTPAGVRGVLNGTPAALSAGEQVGYLLSAPRDRDAARASYAETRTSARHRRHVINRRPWLESTFAIREPQSAQ
jgi:hypothetical protein